jgi:hypothetical protein
MVGISIESSGAANEFCRMTALGAWHKRRRGGAARLLIVIRT